MSMDKAIVVIGTTGVGKTKLAAMLSKILPLELINADALQVYQGLDIATNKDFSVPHHLFNFVDPKAEYTQMQWTKSASSVISEMKPKFPLIVGGSHYYIQSLLWEKTNEGHLDNAEPPKELTAHSSIESSLSQSLKLLFEKTDPLTSSFNLLSKAERDLISKEMYSILEQVDHESAQKWHPNNDRKIRNSLLNFYQSGKPSGISTLKNSQTGDALTEELKFDDTIVFWIYCGFEELDRRLDARVDQMITDGLIAELLQMKKMCDAGLVIGKQPDGSLDYTKGILQTIGFKEFKDYLSLMSEGTINGCARTDQLEKELFSKGVNEMKLATRQYARRQVKWIRNKLFKKIKQQEEGQTFRSNNTKKRIRFYVLDSTELDHWNRNVYDKAEIIAKAFFDDADLPDPSTISSLYSTLEKTIVKDQEWVKMTCERCNKNHNELVYYYGSHEWKIHLASKKHRFSNSEKHRLNQLYLQKHSKK